MILFSYFSLPHYVFFSGIGREKCYDKLFITTPYQFIHRLSDGKSQVSEPANGIPSDITTTTTAAATEDVSDVGDV